MKVITSDDETILYRCDSCGDQYRVGILAEIPTCNNPHCPDRVKTTRPKIDGKITLDCPCGYRTIFTTLTSDMEKVREFCERQLCVECHNKSQLNHFTIYRICPQCNSHDEYSLYDVRCTNCEGNITNDSVSKPTNPKDALGSNKIPIHLWPETATVLGAMAFLYGAVNYGRSNYRAIGVRASIYYDAAKRHLNKWFEGETTDSDSGLPHLAHALACIAIIVDAEACDNLNDDRMIAGGYAKMVEEMTPHVARIKEQFKDKHPKHYTIKDNDGTDGESI